MRIGLPQQMHVLYNRNFRLYWVGQLISLTGTWMQGIAQNWLVVTLTDSVIALGLVNLAFALPNLVLTLTGGVAADRWDRRKLMIVTQVALMVIALVTAALIAADRLSIWMLVVMSALTGSASAYDMPVQQALVPDLVSPREVPQAIAMNQMIFNGSRLLGPAMAGILIRQFGVGSAYLINGLSFIAVIASLLLITLPPGRARGGAHGSMLASVREGLSFMRRSPMLRALLAVSALTVLFAFPPMAVLPAAYVRDVLDGDADMLGLLAAASGGASMVGALAMLWIPGTRRGLVMVAAVLTAAAAIAGLVLLPRLWAALVFTGALSVGFSMYMGLNATTVQQLAPGALRGRVMSVSGLSFSSMMPLGVLLASAAVDRFDFAPVYLLCAGVYVVAALALLLPSGILRFVPPAPPAEASHAPAPVRDADAQAVSAD